MSEVMSRRQVSADATRRAIVEAAARLFAEHGYHATSIGAIASEAGVAVQTIYNAVGAKHELLSRVLDFAAAGERAPVPVAQFMREQAEGETDPRRILAQLVEFWRGALPRVAPVLRIIREAAAADAQAAELECARAAQRLRNYAGAARLLVELGALRPGLTIDAAAAAIFAIGHPETYRALVLDGAWDDDRWAAWARDALEAALLAPAPRLS
ncbi:MAG TPA: helix-turn-helix domain-containing protein [Solirubrobacteraceae bacterium]|nr:helix-turn-helix domain-containing protein [Solirubrobacteraceae bacterium]